MKRFFVKLNQIATISAGHPYRGKIPEIDSGSMAVVAPSRTKVAYSFSCALFATRSEDTGQITMS